MSAVQRLEQIRQGLIEFRWKDVCSDTVLEVFAAYDALAREVEALKADLQESHTEIDDAMPCLLNFARPEYTTDPDDHALVNLVGAMRNAYDAAMEKAEQLERQLAETTDLLVKCGAREVLLLKEVSEAQQRIAELRDERDGCLHDKMNWESECKWAEARLIELEKELAEEKSKRAL